MLAGLCFVQTADAGGGEFSAGQKDLLDHIVDTGLAGLGQQPTQMETMLTNVAAAYTASGYDKDPTAREIVQHLRDEAVRLKEEIAQLTAFISRHRAESGNPVVMLLLLSREQGAGFHVYHWIRTATELTDLADAAAHRHDALVARFTTAMITTAEADQETFDTAIQGLTGVLGTANP